MKTTEITIASKEKQAQIEAFSKSPNAFCRAISNRIKCVREVLDNENPIQISDLRRTQPAQISAVLISFIGGTVEWFGYKKEELSNARIEMLVNSILDKYFYLTIEDICLCFKKGREDDTYKKFYGRLDCSVFLSWFAQYDKERDEAIQSHPTNNQRPVDLTNGVPWEDYKEELIIRVECGDMYANEALLKMTSVRNMFDADRGKLLNYRYNQKHRFDDKYNHKQK